MTTAVLSSVELRQALRRVPTPITFIASHSGEVPVGMVVGSFIGISLEPALVGVYLQKSSSTWPQLRSIVEQGAELGVSILGSAHADQIRQLSGPAAGRFAGRWSRENGGAVHLDGADTQLSTRVVEISEVGDHDFALLEVVHAAVADGGSHALVFHESQVGTL
ncbi:flavin reductase family protein [Corynebacterium pacaense]|uniref:flavin reductase family protein n=1 Tax=Corynebacterium pacaense TaxID=1816684 RepID=UPI0009B99783|nr:flavin reductase family protein [Corynebacterium pacaense]